MGKTVRPKSVNVSPQVVPQRAKPAKSKTKSQRTQVHRARTTETRDAYDTKLSPAALARGAGAHATAPKHEAPAGTGALAPGHFRDGEGDISPDWMRRYIVGDAMLSAMARHNWSVSFDQTSPILWKEFEDVRLSATRDELKGLVDQVVKEGLFERHGDQVSLAVDPRLAATKLNAVKFIKHDLSEAIKAGDDAVRSTLLAYAQAQSFFKLDPVESKWPVLLAVTTLPPDDQAKLKGLVRTDSKINSTPLGDAISLMLGNPIPKDWLKQHAPNLVGRQIFNVTAEGLFGVAGGLGRVMQYHTEAMQQLAQGKADIVVVEPMYSHKKANAAGEQPRIDWKELAHAHNGETPKRMREVSIDVRGKEIKAELYSSTLTDGRIAWLVKDPQEFYAKALYAYTGTGNGSWAEFTEFFSEATEALIAETVRDQHKADPKAKPPVVVGNDAQTLPVLEIMDRRTESGDPILEKATKVGFTHTIWNRFGEDVDKMGIPDAHKDRAWHPIADASSAGLRSADVAAAVASPHRDEVAVVDPNLKMVALTNGTTIQCFYDRLREVGVEDPFAATPKQIEEAKFDAKQKLAEELGIPENEQGKFANQMLISFSGRCVREKIAYTKDGALCDDNLRAAVTKGANVVIYANVQGFEDSRKLFDELSQIANRLNSEGHAGRMIVRTGWGQPDQLRLLEATDLQIQVSGSYFDPRFSFEDGKPVATEASGYTEAPAHNFASLQMGPVEIHGTLNTTGTLVNWNKPGSGSILLPRDGTPKGYRDEIVRAIEVFDNEPDHRTYRSMGKAALQQGRINQALLTAAEYLRAAASVEK